MQPCIRLPGEIMSEQTKIYGAFVKAQMAFAPALKTSVNPHFRSKYADLAACVEAVIDALNLNGIAMIQKTHPDERGVTVETIFIHESGESMSGGTLHVPAAKQDPQGYGSALSYARRYSLMAACGIAPEEDDGNAASKAPQRQQEAPKSVPNRKLITKDDAETLRLVIKAAGMTEAEFCEMAKLDALESMELNRFAKACEHLKQKAKANAA